MTAGPARPVNLPPGEKFRREGGEQITARIRCNGQVVIHHLVLVMLPIRPYGCDVWPRTSTQMVVGEVDPDDVHSWFHAEALVRRAGYRPDGAWTTVDRMPAVKLKRAPWNSPGTVPGGE